MRFLVLQHKDIEPPARLADGLAQAGHQIETCHVQRTPVPGSLSGYDGLVVMGGPQSANDDLPYIHDELALLRLAVAEDFPVLGICLGAQLLAKAGQAHITRSPVWELGWYPVFPTPASAGDPLFSNLPEAGLRIFQWHGETFSLPAGAVLLAHHPNVPHQAFRLGRCQYGLQFHAEVDAPVIESWIEAGDDERRHLGPEGLRDIRQHMAETGPMHAFCDALVQAWLGLCQTRAGAT
ncbi:MAG TPA: type 1 glutamine amidotransferase [Mariprofundaceae bacterium]|nr:type 1 glutamine amidotransferase [Mariprofundaceae bacterium]